jgi:hypothetical protein
VRRRAAEPVEEELGRRFETAAPAPSAVYGQGPFSTITGSDTINVSCRSNAAGSTVEDWNLDALQVSNVH